MCPNGERERSCVGPFTTLGAELTYALIRPILVSSLQPRRFALRSRSFDDIDGWDRRRRLSLAVSAMIVVLVVALTAASAIVLWPKARPQEVIDCLPGYHQSGNHCARD